MKFGTIVVEDNGRHPVSITSLSIEQGAFVVSGTGPAWAYPSGWYTTLIYDPQGNLVWRGPVELNGTVKKRNKWWWQRNSVRACDTVTFSINIKVYC
jgi:hypothetical protein